MATMGRCDDVGRPKRPARTYGRRLLTSRQMDEPRHLTVSIQRRHSLLETADTQHPALHFDEVVVAESDLERLVNVHEGQAKNPL
jgi:hypothetical protein